MTSAGAARQEKSVERIGPLPEQTLEHRYVIDRGSVENVKSDQAYAYTTGIVTDRAPRQVADRGAAVRAARGARHRLKALTDDVLPEMTSAQRKLAQTVLSQAVPVKYPVSAKTRLLVEPETGAIVSLDPNRASPPASMIDPTRIASRPASAIRVDASPPTARGTIAAATRGDTAESGPRTRIRDGPSRKYTTRGTNVA